MPRGQSQKHLRSHAMRLALAAMTLPAVALAIPLTTTATAEAAGTAQAPSMHRPLPTYDQASASPDWARTPDGLAYADCVHQIPEGAEVDQAGNVIVSGSVTQSIPDCPYDGLVPYPEAAGLSDTASSSTSTASLGPEAAGRADSDGTEPFTEGWWADSWWNASGGLATKWFTGVSARWTVPNAPAKAPTTIYFFDSLQGPYGGKESIIQPVLQYGSSKAGSGNYWAVADWDIEGGVALHTGLMKVSAGDTILGKISGSQCASDGTACFMQIIADDVTTGVSWSTVLDTVTTWNNVQGGVMENYGISTCNQLPSKGQVTFRQEKVWGNLGTQVAPAFFSQLRVSSCQTSVSLPAATSTLIKWTS